MLLHSLILISSLILVGNVNFSLESCSYLGISHKHGHNISETIHKFGDILILHGYVLSEDDPGYRQFQEYSISKTRSDMFKRSMTLIYTEQEYRQLYKNLKRTNLYFREHLRSLTECIPLEDRCDTTKIHCKPYDKYRTYSGVCNNLENPNYGASYTVYGNIFPPCYDDDLHTFRKSRKTRKDLPGPREIGQILFNTGTFENPPSTKDCAPNFLSIMFGQFLAHDIGNRNFVQTDDGARVMRCCPYYYSEMYPPSLLHPACAPITIPKDDEFYSKYDVTCQHFLRTQTYFDHDCKIGYTKQLNEVSQFLDNSNVYGSNEDLISNIRTNLNGQFRIDDNNLPKIKNCTGVVCYVLGDSRLNQSAMLVIIHSLFLRLHNSIALDMSKLYSDWDDEHVFQETRRICIAIYQNIIYKEWLPHFLGSEYSKNYNLTCDDSNEDCGQYNAEIIPMVLNEFQHDLFIKDGKLKKNYTLSDIIYKKKLLILIDHYDDLLRGMLKESMNFGKYSDELRNNLFKTNKYPFGLDLLAYDIQRSRDHGVCPYYKYYDLCMPNNKLTNWKDLEGLIAAENIDKLKIVYESVFDVDLSVGIGLEEKTKEYLGTVGKCLIGLQFYNSKFGDRFFYSHKNGAHPFTKNQLKEIRQFSMTKLLCSVTDLKNVPAEAFLTQCEENQMVECKNVKKINLKCFR